MRSIKVKNLSETLSEAKRKIMESILYESESDIEPESEPGMSLEDGTTNYETVNRTCQPVSSIYQVVNITSQPVHLAKKRDPL